MLLCRYYTCSLDLSNDRLRIERQIAYLEFRMPMDRVIAEVFLVAVNAASP